MSNDYEDSLSMDALNDRIAILQDNIRQLIEQAAAASGEQNESRIADRINQQNEELDRLLKVRESRQKKSRPFRRRRMRPYAGSPCARAAAAVSWTEIAGLT
jgi:hypothetical protein